MKSGSIKLGLQYGGMGTTAIKANTGGVINQNFGYDGYENNVPPLTAIPAAEDN